LNTRSYKKKPNLPDRFKLVMWEDLARLAASSLFKGSQVHVKGRFEIDSYQPANGPLRESMQVRSAYWLLLRDRLGG